MRHNITCEHCGQTFPRGEHFVCKGKPVTAHAPRFTWSREQTGDNGLAGRPTVRDSFTGALVSRHRTDAKAAEVAAELNRSQIDNDA